MDHFSPKQSHVHNFSILTVKLTRAVAVGGAGVAFEVWVEMGPSYH